MSRSTIRIVGITLLVVVCIGAAAAIPYFFQQRRIDRLTSQLGTRDAALEKLSARISVLESQPASEGAAPTDLAAASDDPAAAESEQPAPEPSTLRQFAFVRKATKNGGKVSLVVDFAEFLSGTAAADAAAAAGDESPPPNDYYISNTNPKLRTFSVDQNATFVVAGTDPADTKTLTPTGFYNAIKNNANGAKDAAYWFTITNGVITTGEEQWTP